MSSQREEGNDKEVVQGIESVARRKMEWRQNIHHRFLIQNLNATSPLSSLGEDLQASRFTLDRGQRTSSEIISK
jgi:hypothetical protein